MYIPALPLKDNKEAEKRFCSSARWHKTRNCVVLWCFFHTEIWLPSIFPLYRRPVILCLGSKCTFGDVSLIAEVQRQLHILCVLTFLAKKDDSVSDSDSGFLPYFQTDTTPKARKLRGWLCHLDPVSVVFTRKSHTGKSLTVFKRFSQISVL